MTKPRTILCLDLALANTGAAVISLEAAKDVLTYVETVHTEKNGKARTSDDEWRRTRELADALRACGKIDDAIRAYRQAAQLEPQNSEYPGKLGILLQFEKRFDEALACYGQAVRLNPQEIGRAHV